MWYDNAVIKTTVKLFNANALDRASFNNGLHILACAFLKNEDCAKQTVAAKAKFYAKSHGLLNGPHISICI